MKHPHYQAIKIFISGSLNSSHDVVIKYVRDKEEVKDEERIKSDTESTVGPIAHTHTHTHNSHCCLQ